MNGSLRTRLLIGTALGTVVVLAAAGTTLHFMIQASLLAEFDTALIAKAQTLADLVEQEGDEIELEFVEVEMAAFTRRERPEYFQVWLDDGTVAARSPSLADGNLPQARQPADVAVIDPVALPDGRPGRIVNLTFTARREAWHAADQPAAAMTLALARDTLDIASAMAELRLAMLIVAALAVVLTVALMGVLVRIGLKPAHRLAGVIQQVDEKSLATRLDVSATPRELQPIVSRLNDLLSRLGEAFAREKAMTANVAHELRTPLAGLRTMLEVALTQERDGASYRATLSECLGVCEQAQEMIEKLLLLARMDAGRNGVQSQRVDVAALMRQCWAPQEAKAASRDLAVDWDCAETIEAETDPDLLSVVLGNLFENAACHADRGGSVAIAARLVKGHVAIDIANSGSLLASADVHHAFERFWRQDAVRAADGRHCGLGLALCQTIVHRLGGQIAVSSTSGGRFRVAMTL